eukprot:CAMPEP_0185792072 /NCGR_PEP_ID=MMETSP1174-20130828/158728_1 /TAXON_ID=35687 /ORGANISM="Dictyocha speculum, Strain CCMP1381" /LENGTH=92 /DNA_ID=CAMNT_0028487089 /DNA_START=180 /DNA_END=455 /DNA_ORIENTATION=+
MGLDRLEPTPAEETLHSRFVPRVVCWEEEGLLFCVIDSLIPAAAAAAASAAAGVTITLQHGGDMVAATTDVIRKTFIANIIIKHISVFLDVW